MTSKKESQITATKRLSINVGATPSPSPPEDILKTADEWMFVRHGFLCRMIKHSYLGHWRGYVGVPRGHPYYGAHYNDPDLQHISVHGGLTWSSNRCGRHQPDGRWWLGFDCAHAGDLVPNLAVSIPGYVYRDERYVYECCLRLVLQMPPIGGVET